MRIVIYDGILETHLASSLERSLVKFGHRVLNTGKFGSGFEFPKPHQDTSHLEAVTQQVIAFQPDLILVMRPASLPLDLLQKVKKTGARLVAWFSDDPVLFDLSYGPVLTSYDLVLHCGTARVLEFYEDFFGFPTGVNFPFWTDHVAFPRVWGTEKPSTDVLFLGNVHDTVRRRRYFELSKLDLDVRVHGNIGADYLGLGGGYLYTDQEVVKSGASARIALNIPQFFKDHRGLPTWFPGLDKLGFFEYPSRVVQYMAMGIPTISVVPDVKSEDFRSYPEMIVAGSIEEAGELATELIQRGKLVDISERVSQRFDQHFSADARALMLERILIDDSWKELDAEERANWFTQFDGTSRVAQGQDSAGSLEGGMSVKLDLTPKLPQEPPTDPKDHLKVVILSGEARNPYARGSSIHAAMAADGRFDVELKDLNDFPNALVTDPQQICKHALKVQDVEAHLDLCSIDLLMITDMDVALTQSGAQYLSRLSTRSMIVHDCVDSKSWKKMRRLAESYDAVYSPKYHDAEKANFLGYHNCKFLPFFVNPDFWGVLSATQPVNGAVEVHESKGQEDTQYPAISRDAKYLNAEKYTFDELQELSLPDLAKKLKCTLSLMTFGGTPQQPTLHRMAPYVLSASDVSVVGRVPTWQNIHPYDEVAITARDAGELTVKLGRLAATPSSVEEFQQMREPLLAAPSKFLDSVIDALRGSQASLGGRPSLSRNSVIELPAVIGDSHSSGLSSVAHLKTAAAVNKLEDWWIRLRVDGKSTFGMIPTGDDSIFINGVSDPNRLSFEAVYRGPKSEVCEKIAFYVSVAVEAVPEMSTKGPGIKAYAM